MKGTETQQSSLQIVIDEGIKKFDVSDSFFKKLKTKANKLVINGIDDKEGYEAVKDAIAIARSTKTSIEKKRKEIKEESLMFGRAVDAEAKRLTAQIVPIYESLKDKKDEVDAEKEKIREEKKRQKELLIQSRATKLMTIGMSFSGTEYSFGDEVLSVAELAIITEKNFDSFVENAEKLIEIEAKARKEEEKRKALHEERAKKLAEYKDFTQNDDLIDLAAWPTDKFNEYLADVVASAMKEERVKAQLEEDKARKQKLAKERIDELAPLLQHSEVGEIELFSIGDMDKEAFDSLLDTLAKRKSEKEAAALAKAKEDEAKAKELEALRKKEAAEAEKKAKADEKKRQKALLPDKKKLEAFAADLSDLKCPEVSTVQAKQVVLYVDTAIAKLSEYILINLK